MTDLDAQRTAIRSLLAPADPEDALTAYYALYHDPRRTQLALHHVPSSDTSPEHIPSPPTRLGVTPVKGPSQRADGFIAVCHTGHDLFRPLVVVRAPNDDVLGDLLRRALSPGRPYYLVAPPGLTRALTCFLDMPRPVVNRIYRLGPARFHGARAAEINVLLQERRGPDGQPRWEIRSGGKVAAAAGANWRSPFCAEVYVHTLAEFQRRGWGRAVLRAATAGLLRERLLPLYIIEEANLPSIRLAEAAGYADTGRREIAGEICLRQT